MKLECMLRWCEGYFEEKKEFTYSHIISQLKRLITDLRDTS